MSNALRKARRRGRPRQSRWEQSPAQVDLPLDELARRLAALGIAHERVRVPAPWGPDLDAIDWDIPAEYARDETAFMNQLSSSRWREIEIGGAR